MASNQSSDLEGNCTRCTCDETHVGEVRFEVQQWKAPELMFRVKWMSYQGAGGFGWARRRSRRYPVKAVIRTASPRCSNGGRSKRKEGDTLGVSENFISCCFRKWNERCFEFR